MTKIRRGYNQDMIFGKVMFSVSSERLAHKLPAVQDSVDG